MHKIVTAFVLALSLGTSTTPALFDSFWSRFPTFWSGAKEGGGCDPDGRCLPAYKAGGGWDPNGLSAPAPPDPSEAGGGCDPNGRCLPGS